MGDFTDPEALLRELHNALSHLNDLPLLRSHPLGRMLRHSVPVTPAVLRELLLDAIEQLRPPDSASTDSLRWRRYQYLKLRYLEGLPLWQVISEIGVGERQARRQYQVALREIATILTEKADARRTPLAESPRGSDDPSRALAAGERVIDPWTPDPDDSAAVDLEAELARVEQGQLAESIDLWPAIEEAVRLIQHLAAERSVILTHTPAAVAPVVAVRTILRQILLSLLGGLIQLDSVEHITISASEDAGGVRLCFAASLRDPGPAAPEADLEAAAVSARFAAVRRLAEGQNGLLTVEPAVAGRRAVQLTLPTSHTTLVLVVDDNPGVARLFSRYLHGTRFRVIQARNAIRAQELARALRPDVVTLDLMMPVRDGWDLLQQLHADPITAGIPVIACSILPERELALSVGANGFLAKPVTPESLRSALEPYRRISRAS